jgi:hypothetical protein
MYELFKNSTQMVVKKAWEINTKFTDVELTGKQRFDYNDRDGFRHMVSRRPSILLEELRLLLPSPATTTSMLLFMDLDVILLKDPRPYLQPNNNDEGDADFWGADAMSDKTGPYNTGFLAMRPTTSMINVVQRWRAYLEKQTHAKANQKTFNNVVRNTPALKHRLLNVTQFPVGKVLLHKKTITPDSLGKAVVAFHNNFCEKDCKKPERAKKLGLWNPVRREDVM